MSFGYQKQFGISSLIADNYATFSEYNIGDKVKISSQEETYFGIIHSFGYTEEGNMILNIDIVGAKEIRPYYPRSSHHNIEVIK